MPIPLPLPADRPVRLAIVGLGQISELMLPAYLSNPDIEIVALCDRDPERIERWSAVAPGALRTESLEELLRVEADVVDVLVPTPLHAEVASRVLEAGFHLQVQKPIARDLAGADRILDAARSVGAMVSVLEDYLCFPPLMKLKEIISSGEIGDPVGLHMKIVATGRGGWEVSAKAYEWQFEQSQDGRGMLVFDHGWHQLAVAQWLFGPIRRVFAWLGRTVIVPDLVEMDAPSTIIWEHENGVRAVLEISFAIDTYFRSSHYTGDERVEVTGSRGYARCNRISAQGIQEPSVEVYSDGVTRSYHDIDDRPPDAFAEMVRRSVCFFRGEGEAVMTGMQARDVLGSLTIALESDALERPLNVERAASL